MVYVNVRHTVSDYEKWRPFFDADKDRRRTGGATGNNQIYRDANDPNTITLVMEWDTEANANKFLHDPALAEVMQKAGVMGKPALVTVLSRA
jgi:hypothetical protein